MWVMGLACCLGSSIFIKHLQMHGTFSIRAKATHIILRQDMSGVLWGFRGCALGVGVTKGLMGGWGHLEGLMSGCASCLGLLWGIPSDSIVMWGSFSSPWGSPG